MLLTTEKCIVLKLRKKKPSRLCLVKKRIGYINSESEFFGGGASVKENNKTIDEVGQHEPMHNWAKTESTKLADYGI